MKNDCDQDLENPKLTQKEIQTRDKLEKWRFRERCIKAYYWVIKALIGR